MIQWKNKMLCEYCLQECETDTCTHCGNSSTIEHTPTGCLPPKTILKERYIIGKVLGRGGFGITYLAFDMLEECRVAIKEYFPDNLVFRQPGEVQVSSYTSAGQADSFKNGSEKFYTEAQTMARFNGHPNIVNVLRFFYENQTAYYVMEFLDGIDLKKYLDKHGKKLSFEETLKLLVPVMEAMTLVHSANILHRDISPDNIFVLNDGTVKLLDFGSARQVLAEQSKSLSVILKVGFAPVEQYQSHGKQGPWTDIYALAATMYYCLTGVIPVAAMDRVEEDNLKKISELCPEIGRKADKVFAKALAVRAVNRYQSMIEFREDLMALNVSKAVAPALTQTVAVPSETKKQFVWTKKKIIAIVVAVAVLISGSGIAYAAVKIGEKRAANNEASLNAGNNGMQSEGMPTPEPTATTVPQEALTPTPEPTATLTPTPEPTATLTPTPEPTATLTPTPKPTATNTPTPKPTNTPTPKPTATPTPKPTATPTPRPTSTPTPKPTATATPTPTVSEKIINSDVVFDISNQEVGDIKNNITVGYFTITATEENNVLIEANKKHSSTGTVFSQRVKFPGAGNKEYRNISFSVSYDAYVTVYALSASSNEERPLVICDSKGNEIDRKLVPAVAEAGVISPVIFKLPKGDTYYIYSGKSGINIYGIEVGRENKASSTPKPTPIPPSNLLQTPSTQDFFKSMAEETAMLLGVCCDAVSWEGELYDYSTGKVYKVPQEMIELSSKYCRLDNAVLMDKPEGKYHFTLYYKPNVNQTRSAAWIISVYEGTTTLQKTENPLQIRMNSDIYADVRNNYTTRISYVTAEMPGMSEQVIPEQYCEILCDGKVAIISSTYLSEHFEYGATITFAYYFTDGGKQTKDFFHNGNATTPVVDVYSHFCKSLADKMDVIFQNAEYPGLTSVKAFCREYGTATAWVEIPQSQVFWGDRYVRLDDAVWKYLAPAIYQIKIVYEVENEQEDYQNHYVVQIHDEPEQDDVLTYRFRFETRMFSPESPKNYTGVITNGTYRIEKVQADITGAGDREVVPKEYYELLFDGKVIIIKKEYLLKRFRSGKQINFYITFDDGTSNTRRISFSESTFIPTPTPTPTPIPSATLEPMPTSVNHRFFSAYAEDTELIIAAGVQDRKPTDWYGTCYNYADGKMSVIPQNVIEIGNEYIHIRDEFLSTLEPSTYKFVLYFESDAGDRQVERTIKIENENAAPVASGNCLAFRKGNFSEEQDVLNYISSLYKCRFTGVSIDGKGIDTSWYSIECDGKVLIVDKDYLSRFADSGTVYITYFIDNGEMFTMTLSFN